MPSRPHALRGREGRGRRILHPLALSVAAALALMARGGADAADLPTGMQVVAGQAQLWRRGAVMDIRTGQRTILDWRSFSIGAGKQVVFQQPSPSSAVLNRVLGQDPSNILGGLRSNGQVWLINPNGVLFGAGARVDVAGLVASTLDIGNQAFVSGGGLLSAPAGASAAVRNEGSIRTPYGGQVLLVGSSVDNTGRIDVPGGRASLLAARQVQLADSNTPFMSFQVASLSGLASQEGSVAGGDVDIYGTVVNQQGSVVARGIGRDAAGHVVLRAASSATLAAGSLTQAQGGSIDVGSQGAVSVDGRVDAGAVAMGNGGDIFVRGASIVVGRDASLRADAAGVGDGGHVALRASHSNTVLGALSARGGATSGNGGLIETSAGSSLDLQTVPDASAANGSSGEWLIDPYDVTIVAGAGASGISSSNPFQATANSAQLGAGLIDNALAAGTSVTISTGVGGVTQAGNITLASPIAATLPAGGASLTLNAWNNIQVDSGISANAGGGPLALTLNPDQGGGVGQVTLPAGGSISLNQGTLTLPQGAMLTGGALQNLQSSGGPIEARTGTSTLDNVTLGTTLQIDPGAVVTALNTLTILGGQSVNLANPSPSVPGPVLSLQGAAPLITGSGTVNLFDNSTLALGPNATIDSGITVAAAMTGGGSANAAILSVANGFVNRGFISSQSACPSGVGTCQVEELQIAANGVSWDNVGTIQAMGGIVDLQGNWSNAGGTLDNEAGLILLDGHFSTAGLGSVLSNGGAYALASQAVWNNQGQNYSLDAMGGLLLAGGTLQGGTLSSRLGSVIEAAPNDLTQLPSFGMLPLMTTTAWASTSTLDGVTLAASTTIDPGATIQVPGALTLSGQVDVAMGGSGGAYYAYPGPENNPALLDFGGSGTSPQLLGSGTVDLYGKAVVQSSVAGSTLRIGPGITVRGDTPVASIVGGASANLLNQGTLLAPAGGGLRLAGATLQNQGLVEAGSGATLSTGGVDLSNAAGGSVRGDGTIDLRAAAPGAAAGTLRNAGTIDPGMAAGTTGTLTLVGNLSQSPGGTLHLDIGGPTAGSGYDVLDVTGLAALGGTLDVSGVGAYTPGATDSFAYLPFGTSSGTFSSVLFHMPAAQWGLSNVLQASAWVLQQQSSAGASSGSAGGTGSGIAGGSGGAGSSGAGVATGSGGSAGATGSTGGSQLSAGPAAASGVLRSVLGFAEVSPSNARPGSSSAAAGLAPGATSGAASTSPSLSTSGASGAGLSGASASIVNFVPQETPGAPVAAGPAPSMRTPAKDAMTASTPVPQYLYLDSDLSNLYFRVLPLATMGRGRIGDVLEARNAYMRQLFARANHDLAAQPGLADVPDCRPGQDPASGACLYVPPRHPPQDNRPRVARALVVGLDDYSDPRIPRLIGTVPDATSIGRLLHGDMGYRVQLLRNPGKRQLIGALNTLIAHAGPNDSILVYYAGHGDTVDSTGRGYWIPSDADPDDPRGWVSNVDIDRLLQRARSRQIAVISDSCYSGQFVQNRKIVDLRKVPPIAALLRRRAVTVMSSGGDEPVADTGDGGHSVFAADLMRSLRAISGWRNGDAVFRQVRVGVESVLPQSPRYGAVLSAGHQPGADYVFERSSVPGVAR